MTRHLVLVALAAALVPATASAHARLVHAQPAAGSTVSTAPDAISLEFSEGVVPRLCGVAIGDAGGRQVKVARPAGTGPSLSASIGEHLAPGTYTVTWRAVSVDSHRTTGHFTFTVAP